MEFKEELERLKVLEHTDDEEYAHIEADRLLLKILIDLGYKEIVDAYNEIPKWYA